MSQGLLTLNNKPNECNEQKGHEHRIEFFEPHVDTSKSHELAEQTFNLIAPFVKFAASL